MRPVTSTRAASRREAYQLAPSEPGSSVLGQAGRPSCCGKAAQALAGPARPPPVGGEVDGERQRQGCGAEREQGGMAAGLREDEGQAIGRAGLAESEGGGGRAPG